MRTHMTERLLAGQKRLLPRQHATMVPVTTPESPRNTWPQRKVRLDDQRWKQVRIKLAQDEENWQGVVELLVQGWLSGDVLLSDVRAHLKERGLLLPE